MCMSLSLISCDKIKEATSKDFKVSGVEFNFTAVSTASTKSATRAEATQSFSVTRTVKISEIGSEDVAEYANKINRVLADNSLINVTVTPAGTYTVENLTITAAGVTGSLVVPSYTMGSAFTLPSNTAAFTSAFIMKLVNARTVSVTVTGMTDAPEGTTLNITYESDLIFTASLL